MARITKRFVDALRAGSADIVHWDDDLTGFGVRVRPSGSKSYVFAYRAGGGGRRGRLRKMTLGTSTKITAEEARQAAKKANAGAMIGEDPAGEKQAQRADMPVSELVEHYLSEGPADKPDKKASSWETDASNLRRHVVPLLGRRRTSTLTKADLQRFQSDVSKGRTKAPPTAKGARKRGRIRVRGGAGTAWRATVVLSAMLAWAVDRGHLKANPAAGVRLNKPPSRERFLDDAELARLGDAVAAMEREGVNAASLTIARLLALTGARKTEIASLRWRYVDFQRGALILPDSKTGAKVIPLGAPAMAVLMAWGERFDSMSGDQYVFPAERGEGFHVGHSKVWRRLREKAGLSGVRLHDLRHTHASAGIALNQSLFIVGKVLGHKKARTTEKYAHLELDPVRAAADQTAKRVADAMKGGDANSKVVRLAREK
ncbi:MAG: tyrosine-type recombinase/integrase [Reyranella sp.]|uniref:tyrosine-type recombinase/integrase n=1 Tax=Reyranella sp. TaxID=1929291 RepID=UPI003D12BBB5